jgi:hypothetical protein
VSRRKEALSLDKVDLHKDRLIYTRIGFTPGFPQDLPRILLRNPPGYPQDTPRIPPGLPQDTPRIPPGFHQDPPRISQEGSPQDSPRIPSLKSNYPSFLLARTSKPAKETVWR